MPRAALRMQALLACVLALAVLIPATCAQGSSSLPASLNSTVFSFALDARYPSDLASDASSAAALWSSLRSDLLQLLGAESDRVLGVGMHAAREPDPNPDIVTLRHHSAKHETQAASPPRRTRPGFRSQALELLRVELAFLPDFHNDPSAHSADDLAARFADALSEWKQSGGSAPALMRSGNVTRAVHPAMSWSQTPAMLHLCPSPALSPASSPAGLPYALHCPERDRTVYWGKEGLAGALALALVLLAIVGAVAWRVWKRSVESARVAAAQSEPSASRRALLYGAHNTAFWQGKLPAYRPSWTPASVGVAMTLIGLAFLIPIGISLHVHNRRLVQVEVRYDHLPQCSVRGGGECHVLIPITEEMRAPVYLYYGVRGFYQNHRSYVMSRSDAQLRGDAINPTSTECAGLKRFGDWDGEGAAPLYPFPANESAALADRRLYPCGLVAASFFSDTFPSARVTSRALISARDRSGAGDASVNLTALGPGSFELQGRNWLQRGVAWDIDIEERFRARALREHETDLNPRGLPRSADSFASHSEALDSMRLPSPSSERLAVWMRAAAFSHFHKLSTRILDRSLRAGEVLNVTVEPSWSVEGWGGEKTLLLATAGALGTRNAFFGVAFLVVGCLWTAAGAALYALYRHDPPPMPQSALVALAQREADREKDDSDAQESLRFARSSIQVKVGRAATGGFTSAI